MGFFITNTNHSPISLSPGDVVIYGGTGVEVLTSSCVDSDRRRFFGIIKDGGASGSSVRVYINGMISVRVIGTCSYGDTLIPTIPSAEPVSGETASATLSAAATSGTIVGKALETKTSSGTGSIMCLLSYGGYTSAGGGGGAHASTHQDGGSDEINVAGLTGLLATAQTPATHTHAQADVTNLVSNLADKEAIANKGVALGYASLGADTKVPTVQLGGTGADSTKFLRGDQTWAAPAGGSLIGQLGAQVWRSVTMTNIGTAYKAIYDATAFDEEHLSGIDFANVTDIRIIAIWDYVGAGTQQLRWVDQANDANVLWESATFTSDRDPVDSGWVGKPAWATGFSRIEWQGKSTTAADDPIAKGYKILVR